MRPAAAEHGELFAALSDPTRRQVLDRAGLVESRRLGREVLYSVRPEPLESAARWMAGVAADWDRRLAALKRLAEDHKGDTR